MLTGSLASNSYGRPRSTRDADFVVAIGDKAIDAIGSRVGPVLKLDPQTSFETVTATMRWRLRAASGGFEVELFALTTDPHDIARFSRRTAIRYESLSTWIPTAEDVIVQKLRWAARGRRQKDIEDVRYVLLVSGDGLDWPYLRQWCDQHGSRELLESLWEKARRDR